MNVIELKSDFIFEHIKKLFGNADISSIKISRSFSNKKRFFVTLVDWNIIFSISAVGDEAEVECLTPYHDILQPAYNIFQPNFELSGEKYLEDNIEFFYVLNATKEVCYDSRGADDLYYDLLWCGGNAIPVPVFLDLAGKKVEDSDQMIKMLEENGIFVATEATEKENWEYDIFPELTKKEVLNFLLCEGEQVEEDMLETREKIVCLLAKIPWKLIDFFESYIISKWHIGNFAIVPFGKQKNWESCPEDRGKELEEKNNPTPFLTDENGNKYYLVRNSGKYTQTRIEKKGKLVAQEETQKYIGRNSFIFVVGKKIPDFKKWNPEEVVKITLRGLKIPGTDSEFNRYPCDNVKRELGETSEIQPQGGFLREFLSTRKNHTEDEGLVWNDPKFVRMCLLFPALAKNRELAILMYKKFKWIGLKEEFETQKEYLGIFNVLEKSLLSSADLEWVQISPFLKARRIEYSCSTHCIEVELGDFFKMSGPMAFGERCDFCTFGFRQFLKKIALSLAFFSEKID